MTTTNRPIDEQIRILVLNEGEDISDELYRLKKGMDLKCNDLNNFMYYN